MSTDMIKVSDKEAAELMEDAVPIWDETTIIPWGKYKGSCLSDIPASYLLWWYGHDPSHSLGLKAYIERNFDALQNEAALERAYNCE